MSPETKRVVRDLAAKLASLMGLRQGHLEIHVHKGEPKSIITVDKSCKLGDDDGVKN